MGIRCFFLEPTELARRSLRRYSPFRASAPTPGQCPLSPGEYSYHNASVVIEPEIPRPEGEASGSPWPKEDFRWPKSCDCGYEFQPDDAWQMNLDTLYKRSDTGALLTLQAAPVGAMYYADWMLEASQHYAGPDGHCLVVIVPKRHPWTVDGRASNCTLPQDNEHKCWVRHGTPPSVTVDKNGLTCAAGAGSIQTAEWHGFLRNGELVS